MSTILPVYISTLSSCKLKSAHRHRDIDILSYNRDMAIPNKTTRDLLKIAQI